MDGEVENKVKVKKKATGEVVERAPRATRHERDKRIGLVRKLLAARMTDGEIKRVASAQFRVSPRTIEGYISRARAEMIKELGRSREEHQADAYSLYCSILANANVSDRDKLRAQERIDKLLGLESPTKVTQTDVEGREAYHAVVMRQLMEMAEKYAAGGQVVSDNDIVRLVDDAARSIGVEQQPS